MLRWQTWAGVVKEWREHRALLSLAFEHRHTSLCGRALAALTFVVWQDKANHAALEFWAGNAAHRLLLRWRASIVRRKEMAVQSSQARYVPGRLCVCGTSSSPALTSTLTSFLRHIYCLKSQPCS